MTIPVADARAQISAGHSQLVQHDETRIKRTSLDEKSLTTAGMTVAEYSSAESAEPILSTQVRMGENELLAVPNSSALINRGRILYLQTD